MNDVVKKAKTLLEGECWHEMEKHGDYGGARCKICNYYKVEHLSWYCEESPDHICKYFSIYDEEKRRRYIETIDEERVYLSKKYTKKYNDLDHLFGKWTNAEFDKIQGIINSQRKIDLELWE